MKKSYSLSKSLIPSHFVSKHWDIYPKNFKNTLFDKDKLSCFRDNKLSFKCNDSLEKRKKNKALSVFKNLSQITNPEFIEKNKEVKVGNPKTFSVDKKLYDYHDLFLIYFLDVLFPFINERSKKNDKTFIAEIGGGYGGLIYKIKRLFPNTTCILFDLPETNFVSNYYIKTLDSDAKILNLEKILKLKKIKNIKELAIKKNDLIEYDYVILPGYLLENFVGNFVDIFINTRSFMEMNLQTISFYFYSIQKLISSNGLFYCVNRYKKVTSGDNVKFKKFPFDNFWEEIIFRKSFCQPMIHEGLFVRKESENLILKKKLSKLKPYDVEFFKSFI